MSCLNKGNVICRLLFAMGLLFAFWILFPCPKGYAASGFKVVLKAGEASGKDMVLRSFKSRDDARMNCGGGLFTQNGKKYILVPMCFFAPPTGKMFKHWISETGEVYDPFDVIPASDHTLTAVWSGLNTPDGMFYGQFSGTIHRNTIRAVACNCPYTYEYDYLYVYARPGDDVEIHISLKIDTNGSEGWYATSLYKTGGGYWNMTYSQMISMFSGALGASTIEGYDLCIRFKQPEGGFGISFCNKDGLNGASYQESTKDVPAKKAAGSWTSAKARYSFLSRSQKKIFNKAVKKLSGDYKPVALLGRQTTSGTSYVFLCQKKKRSSKGVKAWYILTAFKSRKNKVNLRSRKKIKPGSIKTRIPPRTKTAAGGLRISSVGNRPAALSKSVRKVFQKGIRNYSLYKLRPIALLGTQGSSGKNYRFLCYGTSSWFKDLFVVDIHKKAGGKCNVVSCRPLYLEKYMD